MKKYAIAIVSLVFSFIKFSLIKLFHIKNFKFTLFNLVSPFTELEIGRKASITLGRKINIKSGTKIRARSGAEIIIGKNTFINHNCMIVSHRRISIGQNVRFGPNTLIYDHDHDYQNEDGFEKNLYKTTSVEIGDNVWIGANVVILRGTTIGDNCVVGAGSIIKGNYSSNQTIVQKRETTVFTHK
ncbi:acyltransferase [Paenibacillus odorifer]|uniref:acyltransferase n=1 Tax=Paenibacillus odorifer TaxID=189426 RepID=UPI00096F328D|nr:acyltransferase [Paenibacillus odorifer]OMD56310.1 hypothetical protein BSK55_22715 [Paenibacillus odorifer]